MTFSGKRVLADGMSSGSQRESSWLEGGVPGPASSRVLVRGEGAETHRRRCGEGGRDGGVCLQGQGPRAAGAPGSWEGGVAGSVCRSLGRSQPRFGASGLPTCERKSLFKPPSVWCFVKTSVGNGSGDSGHRQRLACWPGRTQTGRGPGDPDLRGREGEGPRAGPGSGSSTFPWDPETAPVGNNSWEPPAAGTKPRVGRAIIRPSAQF